MPTAADELSVAILRRLADSPRASQRELARDTGVSLGRINYVLRALIEKGWVKAGNFSRNPNKLGYAYLLTPSGIEAKASLTRDFLARKMREYDRLRAEIDRLRDELAMQDRAPPLHDPTSRPPE
jgi:EPS-associated MarR family transcriptional regulator